MNNNNLSLKTSSYLKYSLFICLALLFFCLVGCSAEQKYAPYQEMYDSAINLLSKAEYIDATDVLNSLIDSLHEEEQNKYVKELTADSEYALGESLENYSEYDKAYDSFNSALVYYKELFGVEGDKTVETLLRVVNLESEHLQMREDALKLVTDILDRNVSDKYRTIALCYAVHLYLDMDNREKAELFFSQVEPIADELSGKNSEEITDILKSMGVENENETDIVLGKVSVADRYLKALAAIKAYYLVYDEPDKVISSEKRALDLLENHHLGSEYEITETYLSLGCSYILYKGETTDNEYLNTAKKRIEESEAGKLDKASLYFLMAESYNSLNMTEECNSYMKNAQDLCIEELGETSGFNATICVLLGDSYADIGEYQEAVDSCEKGIEINKDLLKEDSSDQGAAYNRLANCYMRMGMDGKAGEAFERSIEIYKKIGDDLQVAVAERNYALLCNNTFHNHSKALTYARDAIRIADEKDHSCYGSTYSAIYMLMLDILNSNDYDYDYYSIKGYADKAYECLQNAVGNTDEYYGYYHYNLGKYMYDNNYRFEALENMLKAEPYFQKVYKEYKMYPVNICYDIANCYFSQFDYESAKDYYEKAIELANERIMLLTSAGSTDSLIYFSNTRQEAREKLKTVNSKLN